MKPIDYSQTIMYKIVCKDLNITDCYVGHTSNFRVRKNSHKSICNKETNSQYNRKIYQTIRKNGNWNNWEMIEIEKYPCQDGNEARARERYWYEFYEANLNMIFPLRSEDEWYKTNKEKILIYHKKYQQENKEKISQYLKEYRDKNKEKIKQKKYTCECGVIGNIGNKLRHEKSIKHLKYLDNI